VVYYVRLSAPRLQNDVGSMSGIYVLNVFAEFQVCYLLPLRISITAVSKTLERFGRRALITNPRICACLWKVGPTSSADLPTPVLA
jgi:hypothetical protein